ncbi:MAG: isoleucine--tRNA ligase [Desulfobulbaceae bacterium]|jgi:isoleucyl-tRNA synthetase|nr:isoleucine--tRNA ligase [Desulfobulbaceae bacterium]
MDYRSTLNLPQTKFKMKANLTQKEPEFLKKWEKEGLYAEVQEATKDRPLYLLHDGPPYANGHLHMGHAFNKILKDMILKSKRMFGYHAPYVPGWDCHGLPIELNVDKELGAKKKEIPKLSFRGACRKYAGKWVKTQSAEFKRFGVLADWDNPYLTIHYSYEAAIAREFNRFLTNGSVVRAKKPVYWCSSCTTALAEAEVEYDDHTSTSIYVKFPVASDLGIPALEGKQVSVVIWTTTPWTLPANVAVALHPKFDYGAYEANGEVYILAQGLAESAMHAFGFAEYTEVCLFSATEIEGLECHHPFLPRTSKIVLADYVTLETGTGCVHTAPGHGREDYITGLKYELDVLSPVDDRGVFTEEAGKYMGMHINDANPVICEDMQASGHLLSQNKMNHSYPHCWRCKKPVIFRATKQWFIGMDNNDLRQKALAAIKDVTWIPSWGMERIYGMVEGRPDWCLSRQRAWGVPITAITCDDCGEIMNNDFINKRIDEFFIKEGADAWFAHDVKEFMEEGFQCLCGGTSFTKEEDILDVWFDSGVSYAAVLEERGLETPADLYLEGSDQHRGWFQSALLASVGTRGVAPYKGVLTHGFVVDKHGKKMSKSIGNVIAPEEIIKQYGAEILRLWVSSEDYRDDIKISDEILRQLADSYRKIRNTTRYLLSNLGDFNPATDTIAFDDLEELDRWALSQYERLKRKVRGGYESFEFHQVYHGLQNFCTVTLSNFYLDIIKDRLYSELPDSLSRRSAQTVLYEIAVGMLKLMTPVNSFTAVEAWDYLPEDAAREDNLFIALFPDENDDYLQDELHGKWQQLQQVRGEITKVLELARREKIIGHPLEAEVWISVGVDLAESLADQWQTLERIANVSKLNHVDAPAVGATSSETIAGLTVLVKAATTEKCERCWTRSATVGSHGDHPEICSRCHAVVTALGIEEA